MRTTPITVTSPDVVTPLYDDSPFPAADPALASTNEALAVVLAAGERALQTPGFFADSDELGELERSLDVVRALLRRRRDFAALIGGEPFSDL